MELGSLPGQEEEAHISLSKGSHDQKVLLISVQRAFICQGVCFDRGLLPRQPELVSCAGRRIGKRALKCECSNILSSPQPL